MDDILTLRKKRAAVVEEARTLLDAAKAESRGLTEEEQNKYDALRQTIGAIKAEEEREMARWGLDEDSRGDVPVADRPIPNTPAPNDRFASLGEMLQAVARAYGPERDVDRRLAGMRESRATGMSEGIPADGGFLVQTDFSAELLRRVYESGILSARVRRIPISANANGLTMNGINETSRATGSRWGGVQGYWLAEAGTKTPSKPTFRQIELKLKKLIGACWATDELLQDASALGAVISQAFAEEFAFMVDDAILNGDGAGKPLGVLQSPALITVTKETGQAADTVVYENILKIWNRMWSRSRRNAVWLIDQSIEPQLYTMSLAVGTGGAPVYLPAGGASASPYASLSGRPVIPIEQASKLGDAGDISLMDLSQYLMIDKGGIQTASSIHVSFLQDEQVFRFVYRCDGQPVWNAPLTPASGAATQSPFVTLGERA